MTTEDKVIREVNVTDSQPSSLAPSSIEELLERNKDLFAESEMEL